MAKKKYQCRNFETEGIKQIKMGTFGCRVGCPCLGQYEIEQNLIKRGGENGKRSK